jgi:superfamily II DNA/RNA helicase
VRSSCLSFLSSSAKKWSTINPWIQPLTPGSPCFPPIFPTTPHPHRKRLRAACREAATTTIDQSLLFVNREDHKLLSLRSLITSGQFTPPVLIFVQSIQRAKELANELVFDGINADAIHADRSASERDEVVRRFAEGKVWCLICTDVMARGVDFKGVKLVINYDFPQSAMSYIHRIGTFARLFLFSFIHLGTHVSLLFSRSDWSSWQGRSGHHVLQQGRRRSPQDVSQFPHPETALLHAHLYRLY